MPSDRPHYPTAAWAQIQGELRERLRTEPLPDLPRFVAGVDCAFTPDRREILAVALVYDRQTGDTVETARLRRQVEVPYIPGFLSFREGPAVAEAIRALRHPFGAVLFDAHGRAHPRRVGLAAHVAVELDLVGVGVAKSRLVGRADEPGLELGAAADLVHRGEVIGAVLRTKAGVRPVYVSVGNRVDLPSAVRLTLGCLTRYRLPEPTRRADAEVARFKREIAGGAS